MRYGIVALVATLALGILLIVVSPAINAWEKANGYPYGRMCDPNIFNLYQSTCR